MRKEMVLPTWITYLYLSVLLLVAIIQGNYEFVIYAAVIGTLYFIFLRLDNKYHFPLYTIWMFVAWIILHFLGGLVYIKGIKLYDYVFWPIFNGGGELVFFKYDQFMHVYMYITVGILMYYAMSKHMKKGTALLTFAALAAMGIGGLNEVLEFATVLFADAAAAVGGYVNTALDIVANTIGAIIGVMIAQKNSS